MRVRLIPSVFPSVLRFLHSSAGTSLVGGFLLGFYLLSCCHQFLARLGTSLPVTTAMALSIVLGIEAAWRRPRFRPDGRFRGTFRFGLTHLLLAGWTIGFSWLLDAVVLTASRIPIETMASPAAVLLFAFGSSLLLLGIPVYAASRLPIQLFELSIERSSSSVSGELFPAVHFSAIVQWSLLGLVLGLGSGVFLTAPLVGVQWGGFAAALGGAGVFLAFLLRTSSETSSQNDGSKPETESVIASGSRAGSAKQSIQSGHPASNRSPAHELWTTAVVACLGAVLALALRMTHQLMPVSGFLVWTQWASVLLGLCGGMYWANRRLRHETVSSAERGGETRTHLSSACLLAATWTALLPLLFAWSVDLLLTMNAFVSAVSLQMTVRPLVALLMLVPIAFAWGMIIAVGAFPIGLHAANWPSNDRLRRLGRVGEAVLFPQFRLFALLGGFLLIRWGALARWPVADLLLVQTMFLMVLAVVRWLPSRAVPQRWPARCAVMVSLCLMTASPLLRHWYDPARSARLLFSTDVFLAKQAGVAAKLLPFLDESRLIALREGDRNTYTVWKRRGAHLQIRKGGMPKTLVSIDTRYFPQFSADVMQAALPLVLHEHPHRILLLGLQGGIPLTTTLEFPVQELTCVETDAQLVDLISELVWKPAGLDPLGDDRVRLLRLDPALALLCADRRYDVIVSNPDQSVLLESTPYLTLEFYRSAAGRLAAEGIFCQRFQYVDFGSEPLQVVAKTMQSAFSTVVIVETASGELALLGTNSPQGFNRKGLLSRWQASHVRNVLSQSGWDWTVPLNLSAYDHQTLTRFANRKSIRRNTSANGWLTFRLPQEVMRWGTKWQEIHQLLANQTGSLLKWCESDEASDALRRLEDVTAQRSLMLKFPDQKWAYRKTLREKMTNRPRTTIHQVKGKPPQRRLHPDDRRRKDYFVALSDAAKQPEPEQIERLAAFTTPYDPLVSFFVHDEVARLYARSKTPDPQAELLHRLYLVYFTDSRDRSVRNIVAALKLLVESPEAAPNAMQRRDHIDALLQMLKLRWQGRHAVKATSPTIALNDVEKSIGALEAAFIEMRRLTRELDLQRSDWQTRKTVLERLLVRPLKTYRQHLMAHGSGRKKVSKQVAGKSNRPQ